MGIWDNFKNLLYGEPTELKLMRESVAPSRMPMPKPPPLDVSLDSLTRYSRRNELVYACIEKKAQAACDAEIVVERKNGDEWEREPSHPLVSLLNKPNPLDDGESFRRAWIASENFADCFYAEIVRSRAGLPVALYPLHPALIIPDYRSTSQGWQLFRYIYRVDGYEVYFQPEELLIRRRHGAGSVFANVSALSIALGSIDADQSLTEYVRAFFNNDGTPSGILKVTGRKLSDEDADHLKQKWAANYSRGGKNRGGIAVIDERADYEVVGSKLDELNSDGITSKIESRICMAFGVPPILVGAYVGLLHVNQRASVREAQQDFWMNTMSPELKSIRSFLTWNLLPMFEDVEKIKRGEVRVNWDMSQVEALQDDVDDIHKRAIDAYKGGICTLNEARGMVRLDAVEEETGDAFFQPKQIQLSTQEEEPPKQLNAKPETKDESIIDAEIIEPLEKKTKEIGVVVQVRFDESKTFDYNGLTLSREPTAIEQSLDLKSMVEEMESDRERLKRILLNLRDSLIDESVEIFSALPESDLAQLILTPPKKISGQIRKIIQNAFERGMHQIITELNEQNTAPWTIPSLEIEATAEQLTDLTVSRVVNEVQTRATSQIATFGVLGLAVNEIKQRLGQELRGQSDKWLDVYSGSAVNTATQRGRNETIEQTSEFWKNLEYSAILDANLCDKCKKWDGKRASKLSDLPDTPNPSCDGMDRCRCFIITIYDE